MKKDVWAAGDPYEPYVGRWSRVVAREFLPWLGVPRGKRCSTWAAAPAFRPDGSIHLIARAWAVKGMVVQ